MPSGNPAHQKGVESWYPYYAGFTEDFARGILGLLGEGRPLCVMDPWNGSGTTTRVAHSLGHSALGFDINPVASLVASAKLANADDARYLIGLARRLGSVVPIKPRPEDALLAWLPPGVVAQFRGIEAALLSEMGTDSQGRTACLFNAELPSLASFLLVALVRVAREVAAIGRSTNPTWIRPSGKPSREIDDLGVRWLKRVDVMAEELSSLQAVEMARPWSGRIGIADSRQLPVEDASVDVVLTSPPYCTRIDYVVSSSFELAALGLGPRSNRYGELRRATMGTPLARKGPAPDVPAEWPRSVVALVQTVREHPSKASRSYYYKTFWQYFDDAIASLKEICRTLKSGSAALVVVQTSYYKDVLVDLPQLYLDMAEQVGLAGNLVGEAEVPRALAQINPRVARHRRNSEYREAVLALEKAA
ncbi:MAG: site-specific DNA-methyltransferase [Rhodospirillales bacterium]|nr:site-specific DNA-methyltransferase [Rhodospirillales bacterium]